MTDFVVTQSPAEFRAVAGDAELVVTAELRFSIRGELPPLPLDVADRLRAWLGQRALALRGRK